jgi:hypothetical protein
VQSVAIIGAMQAPENAENAWAGVLNGAMVAFLGVAFIAFQLWRATTDPVKFWSEISDIMGPHAADLGLSLASVWAIWSGIGIITRNAAWLRMKNNDR